MFWKDLIGMAAGAGSGEFVRLWQRRACKPVYKTQTSVEIWEGMWLLSVDRPLCTE